MQKPSSLSTWLITLAMIVNMRYIRVASRVYFSPAGKYNITPIAHIVELRWFEVYNTKQSLLSNCGLSRHFHSLISLVCWILITFRAVNERPGVLLIFSLMTLHGNGTQRETESRPRSWIKGQPLIYKRSHEPSQNLDALTWQKKRQKLNFSNR